MTVDPGLVFTEPMIINNPHEWWLGMINGWAAGQYSKNGSGNLVLKFPFGWQMIAGGSLYNGTPGSSNEEDGWSILTSDVTLDSSYTLPAGALRLDWFYSNYSRFWIPLATASVTAPEYVGSWPGRIRLYVLEFGFRHDEGFDINYVPRYGLGPRINMEELTTGSLVPLP